MRKSFDSVPRNLLWYKHRKCGIHGKLLSAVRSLYENVRCTVRVNDKYTPWLNVDCRFKQGCLLSPSLFAIYVNDLAERINNLICGIQIDNSFLSILLYADDIALIAHNKESLQRMLNVVTEWCEEWNLDINPTKSNVVHFRNPSVIRSDITLNCAGHTLEYTTSYKYLRLRLEEFLKMDKCVKELSKSASSAIGALHGKFICAGGMKNAVYTKLYTTMVEPVLFYAADIWGLNTTLL